MRADLGRGSGGEHLAEIEYSDVVANVEDQVSMMLYQQHAGASLCDLDEECAETPDLLGREAGRRLVEQQEGGAQYQAARDLDEAQFAVLQPVGAHGGEGFEADRGEREHRGLAQHRLVAAVAWQRQE